MNLQEIRNMVGSIIDYNPDIESYQDELNRIINQVYLQFWTSHPWKFAQKSVDVYTNPDVSDTAATITPTAESEAYPDGAIALSASTFIDATTDRGRQMRREGDVLVVSGSDNDINNGLYILDRVDVDNTTGS